ncbi:MAG: pantoate--beta-alanine ligase, partial [Putridiphycobacter sp.]|nr:pantoate--beta-alanine ligase [Putridiphycobacter sp.]
PPNDSPYEIDLKGLDKVMEGEFRPGHFKGVCNIVEKLFRIVEPGKAYFGIKDFQQVAVISHMVKVRNLPVEIVPCPIKRNNGGLALSSRNALLSEKEKEAARIINWMLRIGKQLVSEGKPLDIVRENMLSVFNLGELELEYLEIVDNTTLQPAVSTDSKISACTAAYCGKVRLIDNIQLN